MSSYVFSDDASRQLHLILGDLLQALPPPNNMQLPGGVNEHLYGDDSGGGGGVNEESGAEG